MKAVLCVAALVQAALGLGFVNTLLVPGLNPWVANLNPGVNTNFLSSSTLAGSTTRAQQFRNLRNPFIYTETVVPFPGWVLVDTFGSFGQDVYGVYPFLATNNFDELVYSPLQTGTNGQTIPLTGYIVFDSDQNIRSDYVVFITGTYNAAGKFVPTCQPIALNGQVQYLCPESAIVGALLSPGEEESSFFTQSKFNQATVQRTPRSTFDPFSRNTAFEQNTVVMPGAGAGSASLPGMNGLVGDYVSTFVTNQGIVPCCNFL